MNLRMSYLGPLHAIVDNPESARSAIEGGADVVQYRNKAASDSVLLHHAQAISEMCRRANRPFIVNDHVNLALAAQADGVHLGPLDLSVTEARLLTKGRLFIGASVDTPEEAVRAEIQGASYVGAGPVFSTQSKLDAGPVLGLQNLRKIVDAVQIPVIAIGGISEKNLHDLFVTGISGVAVLSAISSSVSPVETVSRLRNECVKSNQSRLHP